MAILVKSKTASDNKNLWGTTWDCFHDGQALYGREFQIDVAAAPLTSKCEKYYTTDKIIDELTFNPTETKDLLRYASIMRGTRCVGLDSLNLDWPEHWYCNPEFDQKAKFIRKAKQQQALGRPGMMLLPYTKLTDWWRSSLNEGCIIYEPDGRYPFYESDGVTKKNGPNFDSCFIAFPAMKINESPVVRFSRGIGAKKAA